MLRTAALVLAALMLTGLTGCTASVSLHVETPTAAILRLSIGNQDTGRYNSPKRSA